MSLGKHGVLVLREILLHQLLLVPLEVVEQDSARQ